ncbi:hypothetical protein B0E33_01465 [Roseibium algicola]|uniref:Uncharacterized protein n=1 Tax=Roseibium algicola TaxID=2857014 RepID=A0ABM6HWI9_9HYPH|nr:hypothetical protein [Roseibium aggregatum]AQQ02424.1 hypothetical protein B0E33_01465 [Roseibium aggregatum]
MSIMICDKCERYIDTDYHDMVQVGIEHWCEACTEQNRAPNIAKIIREFNIQSRALAAGEHPSWPGVDAA